MKYIFILGFVCSVLGMGACTEDNFIKSGLHNGRFDGSLLEYLKAPGHSYDWDSTARLVEQEVSTSFVTLERISPFVLLSK